MKNKRKTDEIFIMPTETSSLLGKSNPVTGSMKLLN